MSIFFRSRDGERTCRIYQESIQKGEKPAEVVKQLAAMFDVQRPAIWKRLRAGGIIKPYAKKVRGGSGRPIGGGTPGWTAKRREQAVARRTLTEIELEKAAMARVDRDPCPRCGIRADVGCNHSRAPLGMIL